MSGPPGDVAAALIDALRPGSGSASRSTTRTCACSSSPPRSPSCRAPSPDEQVGHRLTEVLPGEVGEVAEASLRAVAATREPLLRLEPAVEAGRERGWLIHVYPIDHEGRELSR